jgi:N-acetylglutamate synthase-like GNAT family acetyltransferase
LVIFIKKIFGVDGARVVNPFYQAHGASAIARPDDLFFLAMTEENVLGSVRFCLEEGTPMLRSMMIHTDHRKQGLGRLLLKEFDDYLNFQSHRNTFCLPYGHLVKFYGCIGFQKISESLAPPFLIERLAGYRAKNPTTDYICMRRL